MKKVLLSLSMLAATVFAANAQGTLIPVYGGGIGNVHDSVNSANGFASFKASSTANPPTVVPADWSNMEVTTAGNTYLELKGTGLYYVWGASNGNYDAKGKLKSLGYNGTASGYVSFNAKSDVVNYPKTKLKIGFIPFSDTLKTFSCEVFENAAYQIPASLQLNSNNWKTFNIPFTSLYLENSSGQKLDASGNVIVYSGNPTAADTAKFVNPTLAQIQAFGQINVILNVQSCVYTTKCTDTPEKGDVSIDNIYLSQNKLATVPPIPTTTSIASAASNIASTVVFPNPTIANDFTARITLKNNASVSIILSDMTGRQISTQPTDANGEVNFKTNGLVSGMYTVTYVIDGTPAKTELVVVK
jgi:hypothetical protein